MKSEVTIGVLNLDVAPERAAPQVENPGYLRCADTFDFPVEKEIVKGARMGKVLAGDPSLIPAFVEAAKNLEARGVKGIVGDCGFIAIYQKELAQAVSVPVISSSLILVPLVYRLLPPDKKVGILTAHSGALSEMFFTAVGWNTKDIPVAIKGMNELPPEAMDRFLDLSQEGAAGRERDFVQLVKELVAENPEVGAIVIECTVMQPSAYAIQKAVNLPVFDITTAASLLHLAATPPNWEER